MYSNLIFGSSAGNVTGLGVGFLANVFVPNRQLGGTIGVIMSELWAEGTSSDADNASIFRAVIGGNSTGRQALEDSAYLFDISTGTNASSNMVSEAKTADVTTGSTTHKIRIRANNTVMYLLATIASSPKEEWYGDQGRVS